MSGWTETLRSWVEQTMETLGYPGIALVMLIENLFPPIPSEVVMPLAGFLAADGTFSLFGAIVAGTVGSVLGAVILYYVGSMAGEPVVRPFIRRYGRWLMTSEEELDKALQAFRRHGETMVFTGRLMPLIRSLISIPAGMNRMPMPQFLLFTTLGSGLWTSLLTGGGYVLGQNWEQVLGIVSQYQRVFFVVVAAALLFFVARRLISRKP